LYGNTYRSDKYKRCLTEFINKEYSIKTVDITPANRGYYGETWRLDTPDQRYFIKLDYSPHQTVYNHSFPVIEHMRNHGITAISRIIKTLDGRLSSQFDGAVVGVFDWIDGENIQNEHTKFAEYDILSKVYTVPTDNILIVRDEFSTARADLFFQQWDKLKNMTDDTSIRISELLERYKTQIIHRSERLALFAERCKHDSSYFYITHGDAGGNVIVSGSDYYIVDWDDPKLAPPERDAWFALYWEWAMTAFNNSLGKHGINYILRAERLAYYCYYYFFFYLNGYMETYFDIGNGNKNMYTNFNEYFNCWIEEEIRYADEMK